MKRSRILWSLLAVVVVVLAITLPIALSGPSPKTSANESSSTITFAEGANAAPNYIFPFMPTQYFSVDNINQFQQLMFRPLYFFGKGSSVAVQPALSLAKMPKFSDGDRTVTITMKGWKFADGQTVNGQSVQFFLNMYAADPTAYAGYNPGYGIPDQVANVTHTATTVTMTFKSAVNPNWLLYNYLSEITPFPNSWDVTAADTPSTCATGAYDAPSTTTACQAVVTYLTAQSGKTSTYPDAFWQSGADGPWTLTAFDSLGNATFVPNTHYSGPQKAQVGKVKLLAYTSAQAEQDDLQAGKLDLGYLDPTVLTADAPSPGKVGPNWGPISSSYTLYSGDPWSFNYAPFNFSSANPAAPEINQLYIRQALQLSLNQTAIIKNVDKGYGVVTYSPLPPNTPSSIAGTVTNPYPYNLAKAKTLLTDHGWKEEGGVDTCVRPGTGATDCGAGIAAGAQLKFKIVWASGSPALDDTFSAEIANWSEIGVKFTGSTATFNNLIADCTSATQPYEICSWGAGWIYAPDYYPSGETLFTTHGGFNPGAYSNGTMNQLVNATTFGSATLTAYAQFAAEQLPVLYQPNPTAIVEVKKTLKSSIGFTPNPLQNFMPEYYYF